MDSFSKIFLCGYCSLDILWDEQFLWPHNLGSFIYLILRRTMIIVKGLKSPAVKSLYSFVSARISFSLLKGNSFRILSGKQIKLIFWVKWGMRERGHWGLESALWNFSDPLESGDTGEIELVRGSQNAENLCSRDISWPKVIKYLSDLLASNWDDLPASCIPSGAWRHEPMFLGPQFSIHQLVAMQICQVIQVT